MEYITKDTIATIKPVQDTGKFRLTIYKDCKQIFTRDYKTITAAAAQQTRYLKKFNLY